MHAMRRLLHRRAGLCLGQQGGNRGPGRDLLKLEVAEFERRYVRQVGIRKSLIEFPNGDCVFFHGESRSCQVYDARPRQCRTWPFWNSNLASPEAWQRDGAALPRLQSRQAGNAGKDRGTAEDVSTV